MSMADHQPCFSHPRHDRKQLCQQLITTTAVGLSPMPRPDAVGIYGVRLQTPLVVRSVGSVAGLL